MIPWSVRAEQSTLCTCSFAVLPDASISLLSLSVCIPASLVPLSEGLSTNNGGLLRELRKTLSAAVRNTQRSGKGEQVKYARPVVYILNPIPCNGTSDVIGGNHCKA